MERRETHLSIDWDGLDWELTPAELMVELDPGLLEHDLTVG